MTVHYKKSVYSGFTSEPTEIDIFEHSKRFNFVEGDANSKYAVRLLRSNIAHSEYSQITFSDDLAECEKILSAWLDQRFEREPAMEMHFYGNIISVKDNKELGYGDAWSNGHKGWNEWNGTIA